MSNELSETIFKVENRSMFTVPKGVEKTNKINQYINTNKIAL